MAVLPDDSLELSDAGSAVSGTVTGTSLLTLTDTITASLVGPGSVSQDPLNLSDDGYLASSVVTGNSLIAISDTLTGVLHGDINVVFNDTVMLADQGEVRSIVEQFDDQMSITDPGLVVSGLGNVRIMVNGAWETRRLLVRTAGAWEQRRVRVRVSGAWQ